VANLTRRSMLIAGGLAALAGAGRRRALAGDGYPSRAVKLIVPGGAGAGVDLFARIVAEGLSATWSQAVIVENRPGAANNLGAEAAARAEPDGYTLLAAPPPALVINESLYRRLPFDPHAFVPITIIAEIPNILVVRQSLPVRDLRELIAYAKENPGKLNYGSSGVGTTPHLAMESLKSTGGFNVVHVPYKSLPGALNDVLGGQVDMMFDNLPTSLPHILAGRLRAIAVGGKSRAPQLPDVPTIAETFADFASVTWFAVVAPPRTDAPLARRVSAALQNVLSSPDVAKRIRALAAIPIGGSPGETGAFLDRERERWRQVIAAAGIERQ
jgi:tripartite-type tricarboxylate transporter receptor subunit TctC